jgi:hypothetical protein
MSQTDLQLPESGVVGGLAMVQEINQHIAALASCSFGDTEPTASFPGMWWVHGAADLLKQRSADNQSWITKGKISQSFGRLLNDPANAMDAVSLQYFQSQVGSSGAAGFRNRIINGQMRIDQRNAGAVQNFTAGGALAYCADRFYAYCTGANITGQRIALSNGQNRYRFTGAASNTGIGFGQRIEADNSLDLAGGKATVQAKLSSSSISSVSWTAYYANSRDTFGTLASPARTQIATGAFAISSAEAQYSATFDVPAAAITGIEIVFTAGALAATQTLTIGDVQLESGASATPIERRDAATELARCQRYAESSYVYVSNVSYPLFYKTSKRVSPSISGGGSGFLSSGVITTEQTFISQTAGAFQTLFFDAEIKS